MYYDYDDNPEIEEDDVPVKLTTEQELTKTFKIPPRNMDRLRTIIGKLSRKATKLGTPPIILTDLGMVNEQTPHGLVSFNLVKIEGQAPKLAGWTFIGVAEPTPTGDNLLRAVPGEVIPESFRTTGTNCDHCRERRFRNETYIVRNEAGNHLQVGSSCLRDFLGHRDPTAIVKWFRYLHAALSGAAECTYGAGEIRYPLAFYLAFVVDTVNKVGWTSVSKARRAEEMGEQSPIPTAQVAYTLMMEEPISSFHKRPEPSRGAVERVKDIINYARTVLPSERVDPGWENYINNLITISQQDSISHKSLNTAASLVAKYNRWEYENRRRMAPVAPSAPSAQTFTEGSGDFVLRVMDTREGQGQYGKWILYSFEDKAGNKIKWFGKGTDILEKGKWYNIRGTVSYSSYQGRLEAQLKRVSVMGEAPESRTRFELIMPLEVEEVI